MIAAIIPVGFMEPETVEANALNARAENVADKKEADEIRKTARATRLAVQQTLKATDEQIAEARRVIHAQVQPVIDALKRAEETAKAFIEAEKQRIEAEKLRVENEKNARATARIAGLADMGAKFDGGAWMLGMVSALPSQAQLLDDAGWAEIVSKFQEAVDEIAVIEPEPVEPEPVELLVTIHAPELPGVAVVELMTDEPGPVASPEPVEPDPDTPVHRAETPSMTASQEGWYGMGFDAAREKTLDFIHTTDRLTRAGLVDFLNALSPEI